MVMELLRQDSLLFDIRSFFCGKFCASPTNLEKAAQTSRLLLPITLTIKFNFFRNAGALTTNYDREGQKR